MPADAEYRSSKVRLKGSFAVLGMDVVGFSKLDNEDQNTCLTQLHLWIKQSLDAQGITGDCWRWSPAGDGGYITFGSTEASQAAVDVGIEMLRRVQSARNKRKIQMRFGLHFGPVEEVGELGGSTNILGDGINTAARVVVLAGTMQLLVSEEYYTHFLRKRNDLVVGATPFWRTVKHGARLQVRNVASKSEGLSDVEATAKRWESIALARRKLVETYEYLIQDTLESLDPVAALASAHLLLQLDPDSTCAAELIVRLSSSGSSEVHLPRHEILNVLPPDAMRAILGVARLRTFKRGEVICTRGDSAQTCFFPICGRVEVEVPGVSSPIFVRPNSILGEIGLWIPGIKRTATLRAHDDCDLLELESEGFRETLAQHPRARDAVATIVQNRILDNIVNGNGSTSLFPRLSDESRSRLRRSPTHVSRLAMGDRIDLTKWVAVLFMGAVEIVRAPDVQLTLTAHGAFEDLPVIGLFASDEASIDGETALVRDDSVLACFSKEELVGLHQDHESVAMRWAGLVGIRAHLFRQASRSSSRPA